MRALAEVACDDCNEIIDRKQALAMASITIRNLEDRLKHKLRMRAAQNGRSMEDEARHILRAALVRKHPGRPSLFAAIRRRIAPVGGVDLEIPQRGPMHVPPRFDE